MDNQPKKPAKSYSFETITVFSVAFEMGFIIALPILALGSLGRWLDDKYHAHFYVYIAIIVSLLISAAWLYKRLAELAKKLKDASKGKMDNQDIKTDNLK